MNLVVTDRRLAVRLSGAEIAVVTRFYVQTNAMLVKYS